MVGCPPWYSRSYTKVHCHERALYFKSTFFSALVSCVASLLTEMRSAFPRRLYFRTFPIKYITPQCLLNMKVAFSESNVVRTLQAFYVLYVYVHHCVIQNPRPNRCLRSTTSSRQSGLVHTDSSALLWTPRLVRKWQLRSMFF